ncbi:hypothetical protein LXL04_011559 [Taraxacum kok-saghyz]
MRGCNRRGKRKLSVEGPKVMGKNAGYGLGGMLSGFYGVNTGMPYLQKHIKGPKWLPFVIGVPPSLMFSAASAALGGYELPNFTQLSVTSYYAASSASHYVFYSSGKEVPDLMGPQSPVLSLGQ